MKTKAFLRVTAAVLFALSLAGCSGGGGKGDDDDDDGPGSVMGRIRGVFDENVSLAQVSVGGTALEVNEQGWFFATDVPAADRVEVLVIADGFVATQRFVAVRPDRNTFVDIRLFQRATPVSVDNSTGGSVAAGSGGLVLPANGIRQPNGTAFSGTANVSVTLLDPSTREQRQAVPGGFQGTTGNEVVDFESFGMLNVSIDDGLGNPLVLGSGAQLTFQLPTGAGTPPATVPLWNYDVDAGTWVEAGTATWNGTNYVANASEVMFTTMSFGSGAAASVSSYWNADQPYATACLEGRVVDPNGDPGVGGIEVTSEGVSYVGSSTTYTDADGRFTVNVKADAAAQLFAQGGGLYTETPLVVDPTPSELASTGNCTDVGDLVLAYPLASMILTWGASPSDLDSHFTGPDGMGTRFHVYYSNQIVAQAALDTDDTSSYGPEVTSLLAAEPGEYVYSIHNYSGESAGTIAASGAKIRTFFPDGFREFDAATATDSTDGNGTAVWRVFSFEVSGSGNIGGLREINEIVPYVDDTVYDP